MKRNKKNKVANRFLAAILSVAMVMSIIIPSSIFSATAATMEHPDTVTITVTDEEGEPIAEAAVDYTIDSIVNGAAYKTGNLLTDEYGTVEIISSDEYVADDLSINASVSKEGYATDVSTINNLEIDSEGQNYNVILISTRIDWITVTPVNELYSENDEGESLEHDAVIVSGAREGDMITYSMDGVNYGENVPKISVAGTYSITVSVEHEGFDTFSQTCVSEIEKVAIGGLSAELYTATYDGEEHDAVININGRRLGDVVEYRMDGGEWSLNNPKVKNAGEYVIGIRVIRENYLDTEIIELTPSKIEIFKKDQEIVFNNYVESTVLSYDAENEANNVFDFSAEGGALPDPDISYSVENDSDDGADISNIASINEYGQLTVKSAGFTIKVVATVAGDANHNAASVECLVTIPDNADNLIAFADETISYVVGTSQVISNQAAEKIHNDDNGEITYSAEVNGEDMEAQDLGISIDAENGNLTADDDEKICNALIENNNLTILVTAKKTVGTKRQLSSDTDVEVYGVSEASYEIDVSFEAAPQNPYKLLDPEGTVLTGPNGENGWYNTAVTVVPATEGYTITKVEEISNGFYDHVEFNDQGSSDRKIYLKSAAGGITAPITIAVEKIDSQKPDSNNIDIQYSTPIINRILWFYDGPVTIQFTAYDETSGISSFVWKYTKSENVSTVNLDEDDGSVEATVDSDDPTKYTGTITLPQSQAEQLRGTLAVAATDKAGLKSDEKCDDGREIVVDTISPSEEVTYQLKSAEGTMQEVDNRYYFSDDVEFTFKIDEANFYPEDITVKVSKNNGTAQAVDVSWQDTGVSDVHEAKCILSGDGDYVVTMEYKDRMAHKDGKYYKNEEGLVTAYTAYTSEIITIDTKPPVIEFVYSNQNNTSADAGNEQKAIIKITEDNFRAEDLEVSWTAENIEDTEVTTENFQEILRNAEWTHIGNVHTTMLSTEFADAYYNMKFNYKDLALNPAEEYETGEFIVDHTAPEISTMKISYSVPFKEKLLSAVTYGYYNPDVTVTFEAEDMTSGVDYFTWSYYKENGASDINVEEYADAKILAEQDPADASRFTASVTLPKEAAEQLRGNIAFTATDKYGNVSGKLTDTDHIIVVDTISPTRTAEYTEPSRTEGGQMYYNEDMTARFIITEANFYAEDVVVELSRDGGAFHPVTPVWEDTSVNVHVGTYSIAAPVDHSGDADYVFRIRYTDRSNNEMITYTSDKITIDTKKPVIDVVYSNNNVMNTLEDSENHQRQYFDDTQKATVIITEHNFKADEVNFSIIAKDAAGNELDAGSLNVKSTWKTDGDNHTIEITYPGDANYTFDVAYEDLATNKSDDYAEDYFTVDKTAPENLSVTYSNSILDTVLQTVTFGFYNARVTVTITADDNVASVESFRYNYTLASGVSSVNAEMINQAIEEAGITYSDGRKTATTQFSIPKDVLENDNQFNGNISFTATDRSENESGQLDDAKRIVVDNISPSANVEYNTPVQQANGISYYDGDVTATVTVNEANFYADDVVVSVTKDGASYPVNTSWSDNNADVHIGAFTLTSDGDYFVTITYSDKSSNSMAMYTSDQITIDTDITEPVITINGDEANGKAFKEDVVLGVSFEDINFESYEMSLTRTSFADKNVDVTETFINGVGTDENGGNGTFDTFEKIQDNDGIYIATVVMRDKAGHESETQATFTVNRYGSVYEYDDYLVSLIQDGGAYVQEIENNFVITEYNADRLLSDSLDIEISRDGKPISDAEYSVSPQMNDQVAVGDSGWYQYQYTISKDNFDMDGVYKVSVSSKDATGNSPETTNYEDKGILFRVDSTAPEINSITGFEDSIINAQSVEAKYTVYDTIGLASVEVYVDGENVDTITDFSDDANNFAGTFTVSEKNAAQSVRLIVKDLAGNITDTDSDEFESAYSFNKLVTVSTNFFVRWYANKLMFWGTIGTAAAVAVAGGAGISFRRRKKMGKQE